MQVVIGQRTDTRMALAAHAAVLTGFVSSDTPGILPRTPSLAAARPRARRPAPSPAPMSDTNYVPMPMYMKTDADGKGERSLSPKGARPPATAPGFAARVTKPQEAVEIIDKVREVK